MKKVTIYSILFFVFDLTIKIIVSSKLKLYDAVSIVPNFFSIVYVKNTGAAFSILENNRFLFIAVAIISIILIYRYFLKNIISSKYNIFCYSLLLGGILGNLFDRIIYGYVIDYLSFSIIGYNFPVFNLADSYIVISIFLLILKEFKEAVWKH